MSDKVTTQVLNSGVKEREQDGALVFADGRVERGPSFKYDNAAPHKRINRAKNKDTEEEAPAPENSPVPRETQPKQIEYSPEDVREWFVSAGPSWSGVRVAGNLGRGVAWRIPSVDGRYLYVVNKIDWEEGIEMFVNWIKDGSNANSKIWPEDMENLSEDSQIGPILSFISPQMPMAPEEKD